jgi:hypothetical protein
MAAGSDARGVVHGAWWGAVDGRFGRRRCRRGGCCRGDCDDRGGGACRRGGRRGFSWCGRRRRARACARSAARRGGRLRGAGFAPLCRFTRSGGFGGRLRVPFAAWLGRQALRARGGLRSGGARGFGFLGGLCGALARLARALLRRVFVARPLPAARFPGRSGATLAGRVAAGFLGGVGRGWPAARSRRARGGFGGLSRRARARLGCVVALGGGTRDEREAERAADDHDERRRQAPGSVGGCQMPGAVARHQERSRVSRLRRRVVGRVRARRRASRRSRTRHPCPTARRSSAGWRECTRSPGARRRRCRG